ncbi:MAG: aquaporin [Thermoanaerobaculia bacterium]
METALHAETKSRHGLKEVGKAEPCRCSADWSDRRNDGRRLVCEFIGTFGLLFVLSGGAAVLSTHAASSDVLLRCVMLGVAVAAWVVAAIYSFGDVSAHFNPALTLAFALRGDISARMAAAYIGTQCVAAAAGSLVARALFGNAGGLGAAVMPPDAFWRTTAFELIITAGLILIVLAMVDGPKLNAPFVPVAVGAYILAAVIVGGLFNGAAMNPARVFGPAVVLGDLSGQLPYWIGAFAASFAGVGLDYVIRGTPAKKSATPAAEWPEAGRSEAAS